MKLQFQPPSLGAPHHPADATLGPERTSGPEAYGLIKLQREIEGILQVGA